MIYKGEDLVAGTDAQVTSQYIRDQLELGPNRASQYTFTVGNAFANAVEMPYDGYISLNTKASTDYRLILWKADGTMIIALPNNNNQVTWMNAQISFNKGDYVGIGWNTDNSKPPAPATNIATNSLSLFFYEKRDYSYRGLIIPPSKNGAICKGDTMVSGISITKPYVCDQFELDNTNEAINIGLNAATSAATAVQMPYDGFINFYTGFNKLRRCYVLDKNKVEKYHITLNANESTSSSAEVQFSKGDYIYIQGSTNTLITNTLLRFYKKRDYTAR